MSAPESIYGLSAEFTGKEQILAATERAYAEGYRRMDAYSSFPIEGLAQAMGRERTAVPIITLIGGMTWGLGGYFMEWYSMAVAYPLNIGGRPFNSWPNFIPVTFEMTVLGAALSAVISMIALNRLPRPHHPIFNAPNFERASQDRFFLCIEADDPRFDLTGTRKFMEGLGAVRVAEVAA